MYALLDNARAFSAIGQQNNGNGGDGDEMINARKRKSYNESAAAGTTPTINNSGQQSRNKKFNRWNENNDDDENVINTNNVPIRILSRKYLLTKTGYKFIDIGITATLPSRVNIVVGDNYGKEIPLSTTIWRSILEQKSNVMTHLQRRGNNADFPADIHIETLTLRFGKINNLPILTLETPTTRLAMSQATVINMYMFEHCINRIVNSLCAITDNVDAKLQQFNDIVRAAPDSANVSKTIRNSDYYDRNDIIDCELVALAFNNNNNNNNKHQ